MRGVNREERNEGESKTIIRNDSGNKDINYP